MLTSSAYFSSLEMETVSSSETSVNFTFDYANLYTKRQSTSKCCDVVTAQWLGGRAV
jgi:hypothetical protein